MTSERITTKTNDFYLVQLDEHESAQYDQGSTTRADLHAHLWDEIGKRNITEEIAVYHTNGRQLWGIEAVSD